MVLGKRGMRRVHLVEAQRDGGGERDHALDPAAAASARGLGEWARVVNYRKIQIDKLQERRVHPDTTLDADDVNEYGAEIVVVATGCYWATDGLNGRDARPDPGRRRALAWQPDARADHGRGQAGSGERVLVLDNDGYFMGVSLAEKLAREGQEVHARDARRATSPPTCTSRSRRRTCTASCTSSASRSSRTTCREDRAGRRARRRTSTTPTATGARSRPTRSCSSRSGARTRRCSAS